MVHKQESEFHQLLQCIVVLPTAVQNQQQCYLTEHLLGTWCIDRRFSTITLQVSWTISQTVEWSIPNRWLMDRYSHGVAKHHKVTACRFSTEMDFRNLVSVRLIYCRSWLHKNRNVSFDILKFSLHSRAPKDVRTTFSHQSLDLCRSHGYLISISTTNS